MWHWQRWVGGLFIALLAVSCAALPTAMGQKEPTECSAQRPPPDDQGYRNLQLTVSKEIARPGEILTIQVQPRLQVTRGVDAYLECWNGQEWVTKFIFILNTNGGTTPTVQPYPTPPNHTIISLGLFGPGPEPIKLPDQLSPGWYRIRKQVSIPGSGFTEQRTLYALLQVR